MQEEEGLSRGFMAAEEYYYKKKDLDFCYM